MNVSDLFERLAPQEVANRLCVDLSTAYRWKHGGALEDDTLAMFLAEGLITVEAVIQHGRRELDARRARKQETNPSP